MCLDFETDVEGVVEGHDPGVVTKNTDAPVVIAESFADHRCRFEDGLLEHLVEVPFGGFVLVVDPAAECLVRTVFAPGLCDRLELDVCRIAVQGGEVVTDGPHFFEREVELPVPALPLECVIVHVAKRDTLELERVVAAQGDRVDRQGALDNVFDRVVGQHPFGQASQIGCGCVGVDPVLAAGGHCLDGQAEFFQGLQRALSNVVGDTGLEEHVEQLVAVVGRRIDGSVERADGMVFDKGIDQQRAGGFSDTVAAGIGFDQEAPRGMDITHGGDAQVAAG